MHNPLPQLLLQCHPCHLSFVYDLKNYGNYPRRNEVYEDLLRELELCRGSVIATREVMAVGGGGRKSKSSLMYMTGCALIIYVFAH